MKTLIAFFLCSLSFSLSAPLHCHPATEPATTEHRANTAYLQALLDLAKQDQAIRGDALARFTPEQMQSDPAARAMAIQIARSQKVNQQKLQALMEQFGFPDQKSVGTDGAHAGFLVAQHATDKAFRASFLRGAETAHQAGAYAVEDYAMLVDRNRFFDGLPQLYGTQRDAQGRLMPVEDPDQLAKRRAKLGLPQD